MLLGRTANGLYWMNRYIERAENMARLVDAGLRMALTRTQSARRSGIRCCSAPASDVSFRARNTATIRPPTSPTSCCATRRTRRASMSAIETARNNARMVRTALTRETWEASTKPGWR